MRSKRILPKRIIPIIMVCILSISILGCGDTYDGFDEEIEEGMEDTEEYGDKEAAPASESEDDDSKNSELQESDDVKDEEDYRSKPYSVEHKTFDSDGTEASVRKSQYDDQGRVIKSFYRNKYISYYETTDYVSDEMSVSTRYEESTGEVTDVLIKKDDGIVYDYGRDGSLKSITYTQLVSDNGMWDLQTHVLGADYELKQYFHNCGVADKYTINASFGSDIKLQSFSLNIPDPDNEGYSTNYDQNGTITSTIRREKTYEETGYLEKTSTYDSTGSLLSWTEVDYRNYDVLSGFVLDFDDQINSSTAPDWNILYIPSLNEIKGHVDLPVVRLDDVIETDQIEHLIGQPLSFIDNTAMADSDKDIAEDETDKMSEEYDNGLPLPYTGVKYMRFTMDKNGHCEGSVYDFLLFSDEEIKGKKPGDTVKTNGKSGNDAGIECKVVSLDEVLDYYDLEDTTFYTSSGIKGYYENAGIGIVTEEGRYYFLERCNYAFYKESNTSSDGKWGWAATDPMMHGNQDFYEGSAWSPYELGIGNPRPVSFDITMDCSR